MGVTKFNVNNQQIDVISQDLGTDETITISQKTLSDNLTIGYSYNYVIDYSYVITDTEIPGRYQIHSISQGNFGSFHISSNLITKEHDVVVELDAELPTGAYIDLWAGRNVPYNWFWTDNEVGIGLKRANNGHYTVTVPVTSRDISVRPDTMYIWFALMSSDQEKYPHPLTGYISNIRIYDAVEGEKRTLVQTIKPLIS